MIFTKLGIKSCTTKFQNQYAGISSVVSYGRVSDICNDRETLRPRNFKERALILFALRLPFIWQWYYIVDFVKKLN